MILHKYSPCGVGLHSYRKGFADFCVVPKGTTSIRAQHTAGLL
jgi:hypothetical protein